MDRKMMLVLGLALAGWAGCQGGSTQEESPIVLHYNAPVVTVTASRGAQTITVCARSGLKEKERLACGLSGSETGKGPGKRATAPEGPPRPL
jgi:hypothetical protein